MADATEGCSRNVFVVHGRDEQLRTAMFAFLRALDLCPLEWSHAVQLTGIACPYVGQVLDAAFQNAGAVVVVLSPDDEARLRIDLQQQTDPDHEKRLTPQARPNVLFEAGMALARHPERTILVEVGRLRPFSDIGGRHVVKMDGSMRARQEIANRLQTAGCPVNMLGTDWHTAGDFVVCLPPPSAQPPVDSPGPKYGWLSLFHLEVTQAWYWTEQATPTNGAYAAIEVHMRLHNRRDESILVASEWLKLIVEKEPHYISDWEFRPEGETIDPTSENRAVEIVGHGTLDAVLFGRKFYGERLPRPYDAYQSLPFQATLRPTRGEEYNLQVDLHPCCGAPITVERTGPTNRVPRNVETTSTPGQPEAKQELPDSRGLLPTLAYQCIYSDERCPKIALGTPQMMRVKNTQLAVANVAMNTVARIEFIHRTGDRFTLAQAPWYVRKEDQRQRSEAFQSSVSLEGGEEQAMIFILEDRGEDGSWKAWVSSDLVIFLIWLQVGAWVAKVVITCDNGKGFGGEIHFTILPDGRVRYAASPFHPVPAATT